ncbi:MAG: biopolymer transporter ExbD [Bryobacterales bacterium]|nr:biopolymer transporter ExbD [Bryobacterales bacterium]
MAFSTGGNGGGFGRRGRSSIGTMSEINIVPLVDVVLVLLIIFMLTAQVMEFGLEIDVPKIKQSRASAEELPVISVTKTGNLYIQDQMLKLDDVGAEVNKRFGANAKVVYVRADKDVTWDTLAQVVSGISDAKLKVQLVTKPDEASSKRR